MPELNIDKLIEYLNDIQMELYAVWEISKNNDITQIIERERSRIFNLIQTLEYYKETK
jgi:hypothetical protein